MIKKCKHCRTSIQETTGRAEFCCHGCSVAYRLIHDLGYEKFYEALRGQVVDPVGEHSLNLVEAYDQHEFRKDFVEVKPDKSLLASVSIDGMNCYACGWLIKKAVSGRFSGVAVSISLSSNLARISLPPDTKLSEVVTFVSQLGYRVSPARAGEKDSDLGETVRLSVSSFCFLNVMLVSVPEYIDGDLFRGETFWWIFRVMGAVFASVVISYGSIPFYKKAWVAMKQKRLVIDQSISMAVCVTFAFSLYNVVRGAGPVYFDSVCAIVALLGWGRYLQARMLKKVERSVRSVYDYSMQFVRTGSGVVPAVNLSVGSRFFCLPGDPVPVDACIVEGCSEVSYELLTGESALIAASEGQVLRGGAVNLSSRIELESQQPGVESFVERANQAIEEILNSEGRLTFWSDRIGSAFFMFVLICVLGIFAFYYSQSFETAFTRSIAALLIACPCAFALAVPLAMARTTQLALKRGVVFRNQRAIETIGTAKNFFFDKTGTLTLGRPKIVRYKLHERGDLPVVLGLAKVLNSFSNHHMARALALWAEENGEGSADICVESVREVMGQGLEVKASGHLYRFGKPAWCGVPRGDMAVSRDGCELIAFYVEDPLLEDSRDTLAALRKLGIDIYIVSGDSQEKSTKIGGILGVSLANIFSDQSAEEKMGMLRGSNRPQVMIGNGFNDSLALASAGIGVAVHNAAQQARDMSDIYLRKPGLKGLLDAVVLSRETRRRVWRCYGFACCFNISGLALAFLGYMHPVVAASLMPVSSLTVAYLATRQLREKQFRLWPKRSAKKLLSRNA